MAGGIPRVDQDVSSAFVDQPDSDLPCFSETLIPREDGSIPRGAHEEKSIHGRADGGDPARSRPHHGGRGGQEAQVSEPTIYAVLNDPGKPWQNGADENFNGKFRDECLSVEWFRSRREAKVVIESWRQHYNEVRPHSSLQYLTPTKFKRKRPGNSG
jgi:hypothetical protein